VRAGDVIQAGIVFAGTTWLGLGERGFAAGNVILVSVWLVVAFQLLRQYGIIMRSRVEAAAAGRPQQ
jgi:AAA family ATP:ADP antiporter